jgi:hypothetical protein
MLRSLGFWAAAGFLLVVCGSLAAEDSTPPGPFAWVEVLASDPEAEALRPVVEEAVRYRLGGLGLAVSLHGSKTGARSGRSPILASSFLENAGRAGADFALECRYSGSGSRMSLLLNWYEVPTRLMTAAVDRRGRVDLVLDTMILDALDELLGRVRGRIEERVAAYGPRAPTQAAPAAQPGPATAAVAAAPGPAAPVGSTAPAGFVAPAGPAASDGSPALASPSTPAGPVPEGAVTDLPAGGPVPETGAKPGARLLIAPSLAPFLALGAASYYFPVGYQAMLHIDFLPAGAGERLGLGALLGVTAFQAQGTSESGLAFLIPIGLSLRYSLELSRRWGLLFHLGGGGAVLVMGTDSLGTLTKLLPYLRSGVGAELALGRSLALGLEAAYEVYFESPYLIMGFAPGLCLSWRL